jgi:hypothetical protein
MRHERAIPIAPGTVVRLLKTLESRIAVSRYGYIYCERRKQILSPSSRYSAEQASPPQIIVSPLNSWRRVINPNVPQRGHDITATNGFWAWPSLAWFSSMKTVPGSILSGIHSSINCKSADIVPSGGLM